MKTYLSLFLLLYSIPCAANLDFSERLRRIDLTQDNLKIKEPINVRPAISTEMTLEETVPSNYETTVPIEEQKDPLIEKYENMPKEKLLQTAKKAERLIQKAKRLGNTQAEQKLTEELNVIKSFLYSY